MSAVVWLEISGELKKCLVNDNAALEFRYIASCISMARVDDLQDAVEYWTKERTRIVTDIVNNGEYRVVGS